MKTDWMAEAACAGSELDFYDYTRDTSHGEQGDTLDWTRLGPLVEICTDCPVIRQCATFAMREGAIEQHGVWAGSTATQRLRAARADDPVQKVIDDAMDNLRKTLLIKAGGDQATLEGVA